MIIAGAFATSLASKQEHINSPQGVLNHFGQRKGSINGSLNNKARTKAENKGGLERVHLCAYYHILVIWCNFHFVSFVKL